MPGTVKTELHMDLKPEQREHIQLFHMIQSINMLSPTQGFSDLNGRVRTHPNICFQLCV